MYYFINTTVTMQKSGVGHAQLKRFALFKKHGTPVKLLTTNFDRSLVPALRNAGVDKSSAVNMFDFFGGTENVDSRDFGLKELGLSDSYDVKKADDQHYDVYQNQQRIMQISMRTDNPNNIDAVTYFDSIKRTVEVDWWDPRGFKSLQQFYDRKGNVRAERVFNDQGRLFYETFHFGKQFDSVDNSLYRIIGWKGTDWEFDGFKDLARFFFDELVKRDRQNGVDDVFVSDASLELSWPLLHMHERAFKAMQLHSNHTNDPIETQHSGLNYNYEYALNNFGLWQGMIAPTATQAHNVERRFGDHPKTYVVPVGVVPDELMKRPKQDFGQRKRGKIVMIARLSHEKRIDHAIKAIAQVVKQLPDVTLDIYGYANDKSGDIAKKLVHDLNLTKVVSFKGYTQDIDAVYDSAQLSILTSTAEGLPLSLIEAQSHGVPLVSYDINYGPRDIINDGQDGLLVKAGDIDAMAAAIIKLMSNDQLRQQFSDQAYESRYKYSEDNVWKQWLVLDRDAQQYFARVKEEV